MDVKCVRFVGAISRIQELGDDPHVSLSFLPERGVTGMLELDVSGTRDVLDKGLNDGILGHVRCAVDYERFRFDVVQTVDDRPSSSWCGPNPTGQPRQRDNRDGESIRELY